MRSPYKGFKYIQAYKVRGSHSWFLMPSFMNNVVFSTFIQYYASNLNINGG